jgi:hypothetical protein
LISSACGPIVTTALSIGTPVAVVIGGVNVIAVGVEPPVVETTVKTRVEPASVNFNPLLIALVKPSTVIEVSPFAGAVTGVHRADGGVYRR